MIDRGPLPSPGSVSPDDVLIGTLGRGGRGVFVMPLAIDDSTGAKMQPFPGISHAQREIRFSPDGHWVAYTSTDSGRPEVYVSPYPGPGERITISSSGGLDPVWSRNGRELFYLSVEGRTAGDKMMVVDVQTGPAFHAERPRVLFQKADVIGYDVAPDGRFLMIKGLPQAPQVERPSEVHVIVNWIEELRRRVPPIP